MKRSPNDTAGRDVSLKICEVQEEGESGWTHAGFFANKALAEEYVAHVSHVLMRVVEDPENFIKELGNRDEAKDNNAIAKPSDEKR